MAIVKRYKFLRTGFKSENGNLKWKKGVWQKVEGELSLCNWGLHASKKPYHAFLYVQGEILAEVECRGEHLSDTDKECWREQRLVKAWKWTKKDSVSLAIFAAELCLPNYEKVYKDKAPRLAIEAAKKWLKTGSKVGLVAARSAAESAARSAAESAAWSATWSAWSAAESAAWSAESAAWCAGSATRSAWSATWSAWSAAVAKIVKHFDRLVKNLEEIT